MKKMVLMFSLLFLSSTALWSNGHKQDSLIFVISTQVIKLSDLSSQVAMYKKYFFEYGFPSGGPGSSGARKAYYSIVGLEKEIDMTTKISSFNYEATILLIDDIEKKYKKIINEFKRTNSWTYGMSKYEKQEFYKWSNVSYYFFTSIVICLFCFVIYRVYKK